MHNEVNIIHHDIKPDNLLVNNMDLIKIIDFGVSQVLSNPEDDLLTDYDRGTRIFLPPEAWESKLAIMAVREMRGRPLDVWALGCTFYMIIFGKHPFESKVLGDQKKHMEEQKRMIVESEYPSY